MAAREKNWTELELVTLRRLYPSHSVKEIAVLLQRTFFATQRMARNIGLHKRSSWRSWSCADDAKLQDLYTARPLDEIAVLMGRSARSVLRRAERLSLDVAVWEAANGSIPPGHTVVAMDNKRARDHENLLLARKDERWTAIAMKHISLEISELRLLELQIKREAKRQRSK